MLNITSINHVGIRIADKKRSLAFYQQLGFALVRDAGFAQGHPLIMQHPCGIVLNLLGPADTKNAINILMDVPEKYPGYTHIALNVTSLAEAESFMQKHDIAITGSFTFGPMSAIFIRDPDGNVIELDAYDEAQEDSVNGDSQHP